MPAIVVIAFDEAVASRRLAHHPALHDPVETPRDLQAHAEFVSEGLDSGVTLNERLLVEERRGTVFLNELLADLCDGVLGELRHAQLHNDGPVVADEDLEARSSTATAAELASGHTARQPVRSCAAGSTPPYAIVTAAVTDLCGDSRDTSLPASPEVPL